MGISRRSYEGGQVGSDGSVRNIEIVFMLVVVIVISMLIVRGIGIIGGVDVGCSVICVWI